MAYHSSARVEGAKSVPKKGLTDTAIRNLMPPEKGTRTVWDSLPGFGVRCSQGGTKSFVVLLGSGRRHTIGRYPVVSLQKARKRAQELLAERTLGKIWPERVAVDDAVAEFLEACESRIRPRTLHDYKRLLNRLNFTGQLSNISPREVTRKLDRIGSLAERNHAFVVARAFFNWCISRRYLEQSPLAHVSLPAKLASRDRVLDDAELASIWRTAEAYGYPFGPIVQLLVLTGQRKGEIVRLRWEWIGGDTISLPADVCKNGRAHVFPYSSMARDVLETVPRISEYVFPASRESVRGRPTTVFNGFSKAMGEFRKSSRVSDWSLHDLRRTFATNLAALGTPIHVTEKILNHVSGTVSGVAAVYNRHAYMDEMRAAIDAWEAKLTRLLEEQPAEA